MFFSRTIYALKIVAWKLCSHFRCPPQGSRSEWPVISATRPLFYLIRFFGLVSFKISEDDFIPESYDVVYSLLWTSLHTYILYHLFTDYDGPQTDSAFDRLNRPGEVVLNYCVVMSNVLMAVWTRKTFIEVLTVVKHFDSNIRNLGHPRKEDATKIWAWSTCICTAFMWIIVSCSGLVAFNESWIHNVLFLLNYLSNWLSIVKFSSVVLLLGQRFQHLNKVARLSTESTTMKQKYIAIDLQVVKQLHNWLMNTAEILSSQFEWPLLLWLINLCFHIINSFYSLINWLVVAQELGLTRWMLVHCQAWWTVTFAAQLLLLHIACHFTSTEANRMGSILIIQTFSASRNCGIGSSLHLNNRKLNFSAAGCFHVNLPLLHSIIALCTKYIILLFQFQS